MATAATVLALPFLLDQSSRGTPGLAAAPGGRADIAGQLPRPSTDADTTLPDNAALVTLAPNAATTTQQIVIAVPTSPPEGSMFTKGRAGYRTWQSVNGRPCLFNGAPTNTVLTLTNLDNGRQTTCMVAAGLADAATSGLVIVLDSSLFQDLADLVEAPIPVRVAWNG
jgi:hypothetical protein